MILPPNDPRNPLLQQLRAYLPEGAHDAAQRDRIIAFVERTPQCAERSHLPGHLTGSAWVVDPSGKKVLLTHHRKLNRWLQLGGHADGDLDLHRVALREAREEGGIEDLISSEEGLFDLDVHVIPARAEVPEHLHYDLRYVFRARHTVPPAVSDESHAVAWIDLQSIEEYNPDEAVARMARKWLGRVMARL